MSEPDQRVPAVVSLVTLGVDDLASCTAFYRALGWELSSASVAGEVSFFRTAGAILALWGRVELAADAGVSPEGSGFRSTGFAINVPDRAAVDTALATAATTGGSITRAAHATDWGGYNGYFADPEGNLWEVAHNPHWPLDEHGLPVLP
jgi:catechol 2,3-dioxygenase-like lactoylglutathione lyase family enzyme